MKKLISALSIVSVLLISACSQDVQLPISPDIQDTTVSSLAKKKNSVRTDWYESLRPDLKTYYADAKGKTGSQLFDSLRQIISKGYKTFSYQESKSYMYAVVDNVKVNGKSGIIDAYSGVFIPGSGGNGNLYKEAGDQNKDGDQGDFINCEHTWPQSFFEKQEPMVSDLNHMQSTLSQPNEMRGHRPFGTTEGKGVIPYTSLGSKLHVVDITGKNRSAEEVRKILALPYEQSSKIMDTEFKAEFEPYDSQKGNTARCMLYFYLKYSGPAIKKGEFDQQEFWNSKVAMFTNWSEQVDPVNAQDLTRNDLVQKKQGNRNPFIDIPNLASIIGEDVLKSK
ncbi:MAG: endonuclease [Candidatus Sericytochromatia bacterium]